MTHVDERKKQRIRFVCPEHGPTTWETCIQCLAEAELQMTLKVRRQAIRDRTGSRLTNDEDEG
jgi:hypothetical protein